MTPEATRITAISTLVTEALDAGKFYNRDIDAYVLERLGKAENAVPTFLGVVAPKGDNPRERLEWQTAFTKLLASRARGTWAVLRKSAGDREFFNAIVSDGTGRAAVGGHSDAFDAPPEWNDVYRRMVGYEIYIERQKIETARIREKNLAAIEERGIKIGDKYKNLTLLGQKFSTCVVEELKDTGHVVLAMTKRGSRIRYRATIDAAKFIQNPAAFPQKSADESHPEAGPSP